MIPFLFPDGFELVWFGVVEDAFHFACAYNPGPVLVGLRIGGGVNGTNPDGLQRGCRRRDWYSTGETLGGSDLGRFLDVRDGLAGILKYNFNTCAQRFYRFSFYDCSLSKARFYLRSRTQKHVICFFLFNIFN